MNKKGISVVSLSVTIVIILVIVSTISVSITYSIDNAKKLTFAKEIYNIQNIVTEHIQKENILPAAIATIQIKPSDLNQFEGEKIIDGKLLLNVIDLMELDIVNTTYGNGKIGTNEVEKQKDIYAVSSETGKVYYIAGFKDNTKTYYTLTDDLLKMVDKKQDLLIGEKTIIFTPSKLGWTNEAVSVIVSIPQDYIITNFTVNNENIKYTEETVDDIKKYIINETKISENYEVIISYNKNGIEGNAKYNTKLDIKSPIISKDENIANTFTAIKGLNATDENSGIKYFKYVEGIINDSNVKEYMEVYGKKVSKGSIKMNTKSVYTLYAEDKAGNYAVLHLDGDGQRFYPNVENVLGTSKAILNNAYNLSLINYKIYGNSVQNGTPSLTSPVEVQSVGEKTKNLLIKETSETGYYINSSGNKVSSSGYGLEVTERIYVKPNTTYVYSGMGNVLETTVSRTGYQYDKNGTPIKALDASNGKDITFVTESNCYYVMLQYIKTEEQPMLEENTKKTEYEPGGYKIPIVVRSKNLIPFPYASTSSSGFEVNKDGSIKIDVDTGEGQYKTFTLKGKDTLKAGTYKFSLGNSDTMLVFIYKKSDGSNGWVTINDNQTKVITSDINYDSMYLQINPNKSVHQVVYPQFEEGEKATEYELYKEPKTYNVYLEEPLRKVEDTYDYLDFKTGTVLRKIDTIEYDGSSDEIWTTYGENQVYYGYTIQNSLAPKIIAKQCLCDRLITLRSYANIWYGKELGCFVGNTNAAASHFVITSEKTSVAELRQELAQYPLNVSYILSEENWKIEKIKLPEISLNYGTNIVTVDTNVVPSQTEITYYTKQ